MQSIKTTLIIELVMGVALGLGCSHAKPVTETGTTLAKRPQVKTAPKESIQEPAKTTAEGSTPQDGNAVFFSFNSNKIETEGKPTLQSVARDVKGKDSRVRIEGNCDERGTTEYNLALGDRRARAAAEYLKQLGVASRKIDVVSYGSERPKDPGHDDAAWAKNRRDDIIIR
jgi:peptidoglycan-associated lipoprotein